MGREGSFLKRPLASYKRDGLRLAISIAIPLIAGAVGAFSLSGGQLAMPQIFQRIYAAKKY
jgi:hypothetical protein